MSMWQELSAIVLILIEDNSIWNKIIKNIPPLRESQAEGCFYIGSYLYLTDYQKETIADESMEIMRDNVAHPRDLAIIDML